MVRHCHAHPCLARTHHLHHLHCLRWVRQWTCHLMGSVPCQDPPGPWHTCGVGDSLGHFCALCYLLGWEELERW
jgi:hypothetical protein